MPTPTKKGNPLAASLRKRLAAAVLKKSERQVAETWGGSRLAVARAVGGLPGFGGTVALVERYLEYLKGTRAR